MARGWRHPLTGAYTEAVSGLENDARTSVLIVEDDREIAELIATYLIRDGLVTEVAHSAEEATFLCGESGRIPALLVLDLGLPGADGLDFLRFFRSVSLAPIIIVSARESDEDKILGLGLGADDFVTKPFSPKVLAARVRAQLRRAAYREGAVGGTDPNGANRPPSVEVSAPSRLAFGPFVLDLEGRVLLQGRKRVALSRREFELLSFLALHPGKSFDPAELHREVWRLEHGDLSTVAVHVQRIRRKIEDEPSNPRWIKTVSGAGYRFAPDEEIP
jgi:DNA-binding response OmpR family regulator